MRVLVTGATGFVGRRVVELLAEKGHDVVSAARRPESASIGGTIVPFDLDRPDEWGPALDGVEGVIHLAGRVHVMRDRAADPLAEFRRINVLATERLARAAAEAGARRFVIASTIKVNGERTSGRPFRSSDPPDPSGPYAISKYEAEQAVRTVFSAGDRSWTIVRPTLVYGPGMKGNLPRLVSLVRRGAPLPLADVDNRRSMVGVSNLAALFTSCIERDAAARNVYLAGDITTSTPDLLEFVGQVLGRPPRLFRVPSTLLAAVSRIPPLGGVFDRLTGSLEVDAEPALRMGWEPSTTFEHEFAAAVADCGTSD